MSSLEDRRRHRTQSTFSLAPTIDIRRGDCHDLIKALPDQSIDCIISDPPYGTTAAEWDKTLNYDVLWAEYRRVLKPGGSIVIFCAQPFTSMLIASNIKEFRHIWYWAKNHSTGHLLSGRQLLRCVEEVAVFGTQAMKGTYNPQMVELAKPYRRNPHRKPSVLYKKCDWYKETQEVKEYTHSHPTHLLTKFDVVRKQLVTTQKPVELLEYLVRTHSNEGMTILDPTVGSGTTAVACQNLGRNFIGFEQNEKHYEIAMNRLGLAVPEPKPEWSMKLRSRYSEGELAVAFMKIEMAVKRGELDRKSAAGFKSNISRRAA